MVRWRSLTPALVAASLAGTPGCLEWDEFLRSLSERQQQSPGRGPPGQHDGGLADAGRSDVSGEADASTPADARRPDPRAPYTPDGDLAFIDFFKPHHQMAIAMAEQVLERGSDPDVRRLAERLQRVQTRELFLMRDARVELTGEGDFPPIEDPVGEADLAHLSSLEGEALDVAFLTHMIPHHGDGLAPAHRGVERVRREDLRALARAIEHDQSAEIGEMYALLDRLTGDATDALRRHALAIPRNAVRVPPDLRAPFTPTGDVPFTDFFIPHHEGAVMMARMVIERGADPDVRRLAQEIRDAQLREIAVMREARRALGVAPEPPPISDPVMAREMARMRALSGAELDRMFVREMIPHHASGLEPAHRAHPVLRRDDLSRLATDILDAQAREIGEMHRLLDRLTGAH